MWRRSSCGNLVQRFLAAGNAPTSAGRHGRRAAANKASCSAAAAASSSTRHGIAGSSTVGHVASPSLTAGPPRVGEMFEDARSQGTAAFDGGASISSKRLFSMFLADDLTWQPEPQLDALDIKNIDEELVAYLCLQKMMVLYEDDQFTATEKMAQLLADSMNVVPGLHHAVTKRLARFINLRGQDSLRARTRFRKDMRKLLVGNLACPDYMVFLMQRLWHSSKWDMDDVLVHEAQANLQAIWIPELKTLFQVLMWENEHFHSEPASIEDLIHRVVVAHKFIAGRLPRRAQLGLYQKLAKFHSQQSKLSGREPVHGNTKWVQAQRGEVSDDASADPGEEEPKKKKKKKHRRRSRRKKKASEEVSSVLVAMAPVFESNRYRKIQGAMTWIFSSIGEGQDGYLQPPTDDLVHFHRLTPIAKTLVRIKLYLDKFDDSAEMAKMYEAGELGEYGANSTSPSAIDVHHSSKGVVPFDLPAKAPEPPPQYTYDDEFIRNTSTGQALNRYTTHEAAQIMAANQKASADLTWVFRGQDSGVPINIADINSINSEPASHAQSLFKHHQALKNSLDDFPYQTPVTFEIPQIEDTASPKDDEGICTIDADALGAPSLLNSAQSAEEAVLKALDVADLPPIAAAEPDLFVNPKSSLIVSNLRADFESDDLEAAFGSMFKVRSAHVFGNRIYSVPLLSKEEIIEHIDWENQSAAAKMRSAERRSAAQVLDGDGQPVPRKRGPKKGSRRGSKRKSTLADSLLQLEEEKKHRVYGLVEFEDEEAVERLCCDSLMLFGSYINGRMCPVINRADVPYSIVVHNISMGIARCEIDECLNSVLPAPLRIETMRTNSSNWFETQKSLRIRYPNFLQALAAKTLLDGLVLKGRELSCDWDANVPNDAPVVEAEIDHPFRSDDEADTGATMYELD